MNKDLQLTFPDKILVGFQKRSDWNSQTMKHDAEYKLGYVVFKEGNKIRKEKSWSDWRDKKIKEAEYDNKPQKGFKLHGASKRSSEWFGSGRTMMQIMHPEGFVFEVNVGNFLSLVGLHNIIDQTIDGELLLAWSSGHMSLISKDSEAYQTAISNIERKQSKVSLKDIKLGDTIVLENGKEGIYLGKYWVLTRDSKYLSQKGNTYTWQWKERHLLEITKEKHIFEAAGIKVSYRLEEAETTLTFDDVLHSCHKNKYLNVVSQSAIDLTTIAKESKHPYKKVQYACEMNNLIRNNGKIYDVIYSNKEWIMYEVKIIVDKKSIIFEYQSNGRINIYKDDWSNSTGKLVFAKKKIHWTPDDDTNPEYFEMVLEFAPLREMSLVKMY